MRERVIRLGERSYPVYAGRGALGRAAPSLFEGGAVVTDENVYRLYRDRVDSLCGPERVAVVPAGEGAKTPERLAVLWSFFARAGLKRGSPVIAAGGGVMGDLAGFAAATYMRGVPFVQVPTTLLAQVDASVGGKVAVNLPEGKNLAGSFYQPRAVVADTSFLDTLPEREIKTGLGEVVKHAMLGSGRLAELLTGGDIGAHWDEIVFENIQTKAEYVERDERESGPRMFLNFGHTFGHALEAYTRYERYNHGEAVAIGMALAVRAGIALGVTAPETRGALLGLLERHGLPCETDIPPAAFLPLMRGDKKNQGGDITLVLLKSPGQPVAHRVSPGELDKIFIP
ncbi:MAG: 3-dehydroquinate synthase [Oscillospiraceae bacterium]|nr:3-dehydroquinate synthase [Oscillospiraceae bacterium]